VVKKEEAPLEIMDDPEKVEDVFITGAEMDDDKNAEEQQEVKKEEERPEEEEDMDGDIMAEEEDG